MDFAKPLPAMEVLRVAFFPFIYVFLFGLVFGSFLNVVVYRLPQGLSIVKPRSFCPSCKSSIAFYDNIPVVSFIILNGKCRACKAKISFEYPFVESLTGLLFLAVFIRDGLSPLLPFHLFFIFTMLALALIDLHHRILPNVITLPGVAIGFLSSFVSRSLPWWDSLTAIFLFSLLLLGLSLLYNVIRGVEGLGMGDVKMIGMIGAFLGIKLTILTILLSSVLGLLSGLVIVIAGKGDFQYKLPFGTFLAIAAVLSLFLGTPIIQAYLAFIQGMWN